VPRVRDAGDSALLLELEAVIDPAVNARAIAIAAALRAEEIAGVRDVVSTFRSVAVYFDPLAADAEVVREALRRAAAAPGEVRGGSVVEVPVVYGGAGGPDLDAVAERSGLQAAQVIERHAGLDYRVYMLGFLPGFAYLGTVAPEIAVPRRATPRLSVPAGSVGIAGAQTAVYPRESPGGWQIIGHSGLTMWDAARTPPALLAPGDTVRFVPVRESVRLNPATAAQDEHVESRRARHVTILRAGLFTTVQDSGHWGQQGSGVRVGGAMDLVAHRVANIAVGNSPAAAALEATLAGPELRVENDATLAVAGADLSATLDGSPVPLRTAARCRAGAVLRFGERRHGARAYVAFDGGIADDSGTRERPLKSGDRIVLANPTLAPAATKVDARPRGGTGGARVRVMRGPQDHLFADAAFDVLQRARFTVSSQSNRMGYRLQGGRIPRAGEGDMISDATFPGAIQVPASGEPILLMADRQTTGGYPQIATVITADLPLAAQLAPGDWIEFELCSRTDAVRALAGQEGELRAIG
jgi:KipI family sensor histidine kinase inhibitor